MSETIEDKVLKVLEDIYSKTSSLKDMRKEKARRNILRKSGSVKRKAEETDSPLMDYINRNWVYSLIDLMIYDHFFYRLNRFYGEDSKKKMEFVQLITDILKKYAPEHHENLSEIFKHVSWESEMALIQEIRKEYKKIPYFQYLYAKELYENKRSTKAVKNYETLIKKLKGKPHTKAKSYESIGDIYFNNNRYSLAFEQYGKGLELAEKRGIAKEGPGLYAKIGTCCSKTGKTEMAVKNMSKGLDLAENLNWTEDAINSFHEALGESLIEIEDYTRARKHLKKQLKYLEKKDRKEGIMFIQEKLGVSYIQEEKYKQALPHLKKSLEIAEGLGVKETVAILNERVGELYIKLNQPEKAREHYEKCMELSDKTSSKEIGLLHDKIGEIYLKKEEYEKALEHFKKSLEIAKKRGVRKSVTVLKSKVGYCYLEMKKYKKAAEYFKKVPQSVLGKKVIKLIEKMEKKKKE